MLREGSDTDWLEPDEAAVQQQFAAQARRSPERVALVCESQRVSYGELADLTTRLARRLRRRGVGPELVVGVYLERSVEMVVTLLSVLRAGGAYLPLDPTYPAERVAYMLANTRVALLVARSAHAEWLGAVAGHGAATIWLDREWEPLTAGGAERSASGAVPESPAYG